MLTGFSKQVVRFAGVLSVCALATGFTTYSESPYRFAGCLIMIALSLHSEWELYRDRLGSKSISEKR